MDDPTVQPPPVVALDLEGFEGDDGCSISEAVEAGLQSPVRLVISFAKSQRDIGVCDK